MLKSIPDSKQWPMHLAGGEVGSVEGRGQYTAYTMNKHALTKC